ncbi:MAG: hypothetical protein AAGD18_09085 [Actinomycetota bacterium]
MPPEPLLVAPSPDTPPPGFVETILDIHWNIDRPRANVWAWLCDPATFVDGQVWPYRVEFLDDSGGLGGFRTGCYNAHLGPGMCFAGVIGEIRDGEYRDLQYSYGSYALTHRLFRPTRLQFWAEDADDGGGTVLRCRIDAHVRTRAVGLWERAVRLFFGRFGRWCEQAVAA